MINSMQARKEITWFYQRQILTILNIINKMINYQPLRLF